jgi:hypothetical protein
MMGKYIVCESDLSMPGLRYANIGLAVGFVILLVGGILLRDAGEGVIQALGMFGFISAFAVYGFLDERAKRRRERSQ